MTQMSPVGRQELIASQKAIKRTPLSDNG